MASCSRKAPAALGVHTRSRLSLLRLATIWSSITAAPWMTPRNGSPVSSAAVTSRSATPGAPISPRTMTMSARLSRAAMVLRCSSEGSLRPLRTMRLALLSTSQRATTVPRPPRPPVMMYELSGRTTGSCSRAPSLARESRSTYLRSPRHATTSSLPDNANSEVNVASGSPAASRSIRVARRSGCS